MQGIKQTAIIALLCSGSSAVAMFNDTVMPIETFQEREDLRQLFRMQVKDLETEITMRIIYGADQHDPEIDMLQQDLDEQRIFLASIPNDESTIEDVTDAEKDRIKERYLIKQFYKECL